MKVRYVFYVLTFFVCVFIPFRPSFTEINRYTDI